MTQPSFRNAVRNFSSASIGTARCRSPISRQTERVARSLAMSIAGAGLLLRQPHLVPHDVTNVAHSPRAHQSQPTPVSLDPLRPLERRLREGQVKDRNPLPRPTPCAHRHDHVIGGQLDLATLTSTSSTLVWNGVAKC